MDSTGAAIVRFVSIVILRERLQSGGEITILLRGFTVAIQDFIVQVCCNILCVGCGSIL